MTPQPPSDPWPYHPSQEVAAPDEAEIQRELVETLRGISETTARDYGHAVRSLHAKAHGLLRGEFRVLDGLPEVLAQGLFASPATYPALLRLSTNPGDVLDDSVSAPRGLAIKVRGVPGPRLPGSESEDSQDYVLANAPAFLVPDPKAFLSSLKLLAATTDTPQAPKKLLSAALRGLGGAIEAMGATPPAALKGLGGQPMTHILGESFFSQAPLLHGPYVAKLAVVPISSALTSLAGTKLDLRGGPDALREAVVAFFRENDAEWEMRVQLCTDPATMPIEDPSIPWPEERSPYVPVARITAPRQHAWDEGRVREIDEALSFSPWHGLAAHRPLGAIMRARRPAYEMSAGFRAARNGCPVRG
jgi:hypothetical protein